MEKNVTKERRGIKAIGKCRNECGTHALWDKTRLIWASYHSLSHELGSE